MAQTTTAVNACAARVYVDIGDGTLTEISGSTTEVTPNFESSEGSVQTLEGRWPIRKVCKSDGSFSLSVVYSTTGDEGLDLLRDWWFDNANYNVARSIRIDQPDSAAGSDRYQCEAYLTSFTFTLAASEPGPVVVSAELLPEGEITFSTIAS